MAASTADTPIFLIGFTWNIPSKMPAIPTNFTEFHNPKVALLTVLQKREKQFFPLFNIEGIEIANLQIFEMLFH